MSNQRIGELGECFVAHCLEQNGWIILAQRWHCRWGEIDIIVQAPAPSQQLVFVEVKVRHAGNGCGRFNGNWDQSGLLSITPQKRQKLILAAQTFLSENAGFANFNCRFDVALIGYEKRPCGSFWKGPQDSGLTALDSRSDQTFNGVSTPDWTTVDDQKIEFTIQHYIQGAFDVE
ncbi:MAG: YraN family protein [Cyanobacteria bacterium P01_F01_bin.150]